MDGVGRWADQALRDPVGNVEIGEDGRYPRLVGAVDLAEVPAFMCPLEPSVANIPNHHPASVSRTSISINRSMIGVEAVDEGSIVRWGSRPRLRRVHSA